MVIVAPFFAKHCLQNQWCALLAFWEIVTLVELFVSPPGTHQVRLKTRCCQWWIPVDESMLNPGITNYFPQKLLGFIENVCKYIGYSLYSLYMNSNFFLCHIMIMNVWEYVGIILHQPVSFHISGSRRSKLPWSRSWMLWQHHGFWWILIYLVATLGCLRLCPKKARTPKKWPHSFLNKRQGEDDEQPWQPW